MLLLAQNRILTKDRPVTWLTQPSAVGATQLTVKAVDNNAWNDNDWVIVGDIGTPNSEVLQINGSVNDGVTLTVDNAGAGGARFAHSVDEPIFRIDYNMIKWYRSLTPTGTKTLMATTELQTADYDSFYDDTVIAHTTGYGFAAFFNSFTFGTSPFSDGIPYTGQSQRSLAKLITKCRSLMDEQQDDFISDTDIKNAINDKQRDILDERLWTFNEVSYSTSSIQYQFDYAKPEQIKTFHTVRFGTWPLRNISEARWEMLHWDTQQQTTTPTHVAVFQENARIYPSPQAGAATVNLVGAINATDVSIVCTSSGGFLIGDYYRFTIDSEIIYATFFVPATNSFTGCKRGQEGTEAASHANNALVTQNDIVFTGQQQPEDLTKLNDETIIPESLVICYGVASDFCNGKLNKATLGDRYQLKYSDAIESLRNKYTLKMTSQFGRVRAPEEVVSDNGNITNPNSYPQNIIAPPLSP